MNGRAFLDTNIFIYSLDRVDPRKAGVAMQIIREHAASGTGVISFQVIQEFFNVAFKRFPATMTLEDGTGYLLTVLRPFLAVNSSLALYSGALSVRSRYQVSWYDSLIIAAALEANCSILYTEDLHHGAKMGGLRIENPFRAG
jgi:predicted nucleic acid-binding protein